MGEFTSNGVAVEYIYKVSAKFIICLQKDGKIIVRIMENFPIVETKLNTFKSANVTNDNNFMQMRY